MGQVTIYLDSETEARLKLAAKSSNVSVSKWVSAMIRKQTQSEWPQEVHDLAGSWGDEFSTLDQIRNDQG